MNDVNIKQDHTALWVWVCVVVGAVCAAMVCGWAGSFVEEHTEEPVRTTAIEWCAVCVDYQITFRGSVGDVLVCSVCDTVLTW